MTRRIAALLPLAFALGCGAAAPSAAPVAPAEEPLGVAAAKPHTPAKAEKKKDAELAEAPRGGDSAAPTSVARATSAPTDAPLVSTITQDAVLAQVSRSSDAFNRCYSLGAGASKTWRAKVTIKATVGPNGNVASVDVQSSTAKNRRVDACVVEAFKKLVFKRPKGSGTTTFTFPLSFDGMEQVQ